VPCRAVPCGAVPCRVVRDGPSADITILFLVEHQVSRGTLVVTVVVLIVIVINVVIITIIINTISFSVNIIIPPYGQRRNQRIQKLVFLGIIFTRLKKKHRVPED
jgi:hypothetical protein